MTAPVPATASTRHWSALDGVRACAVVIVMLYHFGRAQPKGGFLGIDMFFVLSGFLITSLLVGEREKRGRVSYGNFYARRALRLLPALFAVLIFVTVVSLILGNRVQSHQTLTTVPWTFFYLANWEQTFGHLGQLGMLDHTWSLSVEEQFYILWPLTLTGLMLVIKDRRVLAVILFAASLGDMLYRGILVHDGASFLRVYYATDTHCDGLLLGCAMALLLASRTKPSSALARRASKVAACAGVVGLVVSVLTFSPFITNSYERAIPIAVVSVGAIIWNLVTDPFRPLQLILASPPMVWIGKRSYGLYLWHWPIYVIVTAYWGIHHNRADLTEFVLAFVAATLSYRFIEQPFLRRKVRFEVTEALPAGATAPPVETS